MNFFYIYQNCNFKTLKMAVNIRATSLPNSYSEEKQALRSKTFEKKEIIHRSYLCKTESEMRSNLACFTTATLHYLEA